MPPTDISGAELKLHDLVIVTGAHPTHISDPDPQMRRFFQSMIGCYGLVTHPFRDEIEAPWFDAADDSLYVDVRIATDEAIIAYATGFPPSRLQRIGYNVILSAAFADYAWELPDEKGSSIRVIVPSTEQYQFIRRILALSPQELGVLHGRIFG